MRCAYQAYGAVIAFVGRIRRLRRIRQLLMPNALRLSGLRRCYRFCRLDKAFTPHPATARSRRLIVMLHIGGKHIAQPAQGFDQHWLVRVVLYFAPQPHD